MAPESAVSLRPVTPQDAPALLEIYRPYVLETTVTFETAVPEEAEFARRIGDIAPRFPYLAAEAPEGTLLGYAYARPFGERAAYRWTVETSIYLRREVRGRGIGKKLYRALLAILEKQGVRSAVAVITVPGEESLGFHRALGFQDRGLIPRAGYKRGLWCGVAHLQYELPAPREAPGPLIPMEALDPAFVSRTLRAAAEA